MKPTKNELAEKANEIMSNAGSKEKAVESFLYMAEHAKENVERHYWIMRAVNVDIDDSEKLDMLANRYAKLLGLFSEISNSLIKHEGLPK